MDDTVPLGSGDYWILLVLLIFSRAMDFLSTWMATPNLVLEGNPIAKKLGWRWGMVLNLGMCLGFALTPVPAIAVCTTSVLVAAHNFNNAWLMRTMGEYHYANWHIDRVIETPFRFYLTCLLGQTGLTASVGAALIYCGESDWRVFAIGVGLVTYAAVVLIFTLLAAWRIRRNHR